MKRIVLGSIALLMIVVSSFVMSPNKAEADSWGEWKTHKCYKGLDYRTKFGEHSKYKGKYKWYIQYRNRYERKMHLTFSMSDGPYETADYPQRMTISANGGMLMASDFVKSDQTMYIHTTKVRIGYHDTYRNKAECDND